MRIVHLSLLFFCSFFLQTSANNAALPYEILLWYYAYKAQYQRGGGQVWEIFYEFQHLPAMNFGQWVERIVPFGNVKAGWPSTEPFWSSTTADETTTPTIDNTNRLVSYAEPNARINLRGMNINWDKIASTQTVGQPGMSSMLKNMLSSLQKIWAINPNSLDATDLGVMKEASEGMMLQRQIVNWVDMSQWLINDKYGGSHLLAPYLVDASGNLLDHFDTIQIQANINNPPEGIQTSGDEKLALLGYLQAGSSNFGNRAYGLANNINWGKYWGGADTHMKVITQGQKMVEFLEDKFTGANQLPTEACS